MKYLIIPFLLFSTAYASQATETSFPVFLKFGFSSVLEFDSTPTQVVLGDSQSFQVEKLESSLVVRSLVSEAITNMFVYLKNGQVKLFTLTASEEAVPTQLSQFKAPSTTKAKVNKPKPTRKTRPYRNNIRLLRASFDQKKDLLTVEVAISAGSSTSLTPRWNYIDLRHKDKVFKVKTMWAERKVVQRDSVVKARFIFLRPDISRNFAETYLQIPLEGRATPIRINLKGGV